MKAQQVAITGYGIVSALGAGAGEMWSNLMAGRSGLGTLTLFESPRCGQTPIAQVRDFTPAPEVAQRSRSIQLAMHAARDAHDAAGLGSVFGAERNRIGLVLGACSGGMLETEECVGAFLEHSDLQEHRLGDHTIATVTEAVAHQLGLGGYRTTVSTACSSGAMAIAVACDLLASGELDVVLAGGVDTLTRLTLNGFSSLLIVAADGCRPFDANRSGMSLGEGAAVLLLEHPEHARARHAPIYGGVAGWGANCDASNPIAPDPDGAGLLCAMSRALQCASVEPDQIGYVNAHGTGTIENDSAEARAIRRLFGDGCPPVSSTKRFFGHTLAAAGAIEAVVSLMALHHRTAPATLGLRTVDEAMEISPIVEPAPVDTGLALTNSMGFGGNNCALLLARNREFRMTRRTAALARRTLSADVLGLGVVCAEGRREELELPPGSDVKRILSYTPGRRGAANGMDANRLRRLGSAHRMAAEAAFLALAQSGAPPALRENYAICVGTGMGTVNDTTEFILNMIEREERQPKPALFVNSVHNSIAAQIAILLGLRGENHTFSHETGSFEAALRQGLAITSTGRWPGTLVCGVDELDAHVAAVLIKRRWLNPALESIEPMPPTQARARGTLPGQGAAALVLAPAGGAPPTGRLATIAGLSAGPACDRREDGDELRFVRGALSAAELAIADVSFVLFGANGDARVDDACRRVARLLSDEAGREITCGAYRQRCGDYCTASAVGLATAVSMVNGCEEPRDKEGKSEVEDREPPANVVCIEMTPERGWNACVVVR